MNVDRHLLTGENVIEQKGEERNSLNLLLDVNKKIVQVLVDGGRPGEAEKITEGPID